MLDVPSNIQNLNPSQPYKSIFERLQLQLYDTKLTAEAPHHTVYRQEFNAEDLQNRMWYKAESNEPVRYWTHKMLWSLLRTSLMNSYTCFKEYGGEKMDLARYRREVCEAILDTMPKKLTKSGGVRERRKTKK